MRILGALLLCSALGQGAAQVNSITFEQNRGQSNPETRYIARCQGSAFLIEDNAIVFARSGRNGNLRAARLQFEGAGLIAAWQSLDPVTGTTSYIVGRDRTRWALDVPHYRRIVRKNIYPGIDLALYSGGGRMEYDFLLAPGADPTRIRFRFVGDSKLALAANGDMALGSAAGGLVQKKPRLYQTGADGSRRRSKADTGCFKTTAAVLESAGTTQAAL